MSKLEPVLVTDPAEIEKGLRAHGVPFERTFVASLEDARRARRDLRRFVGSLLKTASRQDARQLRQILRTEGAYIWHCGGFERSGSRYLHCSFVRFRSEDLRAPRFPVIYDGGADVARCNFSLRAGQIVTIAWNADV
jgi:hypothetical protein